jgi:hypothetical protein
LINLGLACSKTGQELASSPITRSESDSSLA